LKIILYLYIVAISSIPRANSEMKILEISGIIAPTVVVFLLASPLATAFGRYPNLSIVANTFFRVVGLTLGLPFTTRDTVAIDTFASLATSYIVTLIFLPPRFTDNHRLLLPSSYSTKP